MSHDTTTTKDAVCYTQWAIDAANEIQDHFNALNLTGACGKIAAIITRHAPKPESPSDFELYQTGSQIIRNAQDARIAELEADNARLREGFQRIRALLKAGRFPDAMLVCVTTGSDAPIIVAQD